MIIVVVLVDMVMIKIHVVFSNFWHLYFKKIKLYHLLKIQQVSIFLSTQTFNEGLARTY